MNQEEANAEVEPTYPRLLLGTGAAYALLHHLGLLPTGT